MYALAWAVMLLPLLGCVLSFVAETPRRAAHICMSLVGASLVVALVVLGYRLAHETASPTPYLSTLNFLSITPDPSETSIFPSTFQVAVGVRVDNLSTSFMALIPFLVLVVQGLGISMLERDSGYRRFFWASSVLASAMLAMVESPGLFQAWVALGIISAVTLVLALHWWQRPGTANPARRAFTVLLGADLTLLLGLVFLVDKLGSYIGLESQPSTGALDITDFRLLDPAWQAAAQGTVASTGYRSLVILTVLLAVAGLAHAAHPPVTGWLTGLREAPLPVLGAVAISLLGGVVLLARVYDLLLVTRHVLSGIAVVGGVAAVWLSAACLRSHDLYRVALLSTAAQLALAVTALGAGGYSAALLITFVSAPLSLLLLVTAGSLARAYRTRDIGAMGGAWGRMRRTSLSLGIWAAAASGLDLVGYDVISTVLLNRFPNGGHMSGAARDLVLALVISALLLTTLYAVRMVVTICAGTPAVRRGFTADRLAEAEPRLRSLQTWAAAATAAAVVIGLPGISAIGHGRGRVPALTFSHWVYFGTAHQDLPVQGWAFAVLVAVLAAGTAGAVAVPSLGLGRLWARLPLAGLASAVPAAVRGAVGLGVRAGEVVSDEVLAVDRGLVEPLYDATGQGLEIGAWALGRARSRRLRLGLGVALAVVLLLVGASILAAGGHLPVHTT